MAEETHKKVLRIPRKICDPNFATVMLQLWVSILSFLFYILHIKKHVLELVVELVPSTIISHILEVYIKFHVHLSHNL